MEALNFVEVAKLVNRIGTIHIPETPTESEQGQWALHDCTIKVGGIQGTLRILYLFSDATQPGTRKARALCKPEKMAFTQVVFADSLLTKNRAVVESFRGKVASILGLTEYFTSFITAQIQNYLSKIQALDFKDYVDPHVTVSETFTRKLPNPALSFLTDPDLVEQRFSGTMAVLLGEPGQGKTFMSRYLAHACAQRGLVPIYVHSEQWTRMQPDELTSLWKTIAHSFRYFEAPIGWVDGAEEQFLRVALRTGRFRVIFDGFDEFVLWNKGSVDALETIRSLQSLSDSTGTRILVSSRTSFWESEIDGEDADGAQPKHVLRIEPFDQNNAQLYFVRRFPRSQAKQKAALGIFTTLRSRVESKSSHFVGRGFFLFLIADLVDRGFTLASLQLNESTVFQWMMEALCEREQRRQNLPISAAQQLDAISNFAELVVRGEPPRAETLSFVIQATSNVSQQEAESLVAPSGKLKDHPLLRRDPSGTWGFVQEQVHFNLLANLIITAAIRQRDSSHLEKLVASPGLTARLQADVAAAIVEQVFEKDDATVCESTIRNMIGALASTVPSPGGIATEVTAAASLAASIALLTVNRLFAKGASHAERAASLLSLLPPPGLQRLYFTGSLARFDFSTTRFENCTFDSVAWANCSFSDRTCFVSCRFVGGTMVACTGFGLASFSPSCVIDTEAKALIDSEAIRAGRKDYIRDDLRSDIACLVQKFIFKDGLGLRTIEERGLERGTISNSIHKAEIVDAFTRTIVEPHALGAGKTGLHVRESAKAALNYFSANGVLTGPLAALFDQLAEKLAVPR